MFRLIQNRMQHVLLALSTDNERAPIRMVDHRESKGNPLLWWFRTIVQPSDPTIRLAQKLVSGEEGAGVSIRTHTEEDEVEDGESGGVLLSEEGDQLFFVFVGELVQVVEEGFVDRVDLRTRDRDMFEEGFVTCSEVAVLVIEFNYSFIAEEDLPKNRTQRIAHSLVLRSDASSNTVHALTTSPTVLLAVRPNPSNY